MTVPAFPIDCDTVSYPVAELVDPVESLGDANIGYNGSQRYVRVWLNHQNGTIMYDDGSVGGEGNDGLFNSWDRTMACRLRNEHNLAASDSDGGDEHRRLSQILHSYGWDIGFDDKATANLLYDRTAEALYVMPTDKAHKFTKQFNDTPDRLPEQAQRDMLEKLQSAFEELADDLDQFDND